eukprot:gene21690-28712_t
MRTEALGKVEAGMEARRLGVMLSAEASELNCERRKKNLHGASESRCTYELFLELAGGRHSSTQGGLFQTASQAIGSAHRTFSTSGPVPKGGLGQHGAIPLQYHKLPAYSLSERDAEGLQAAVHLIKLLKQRGHAAFIAGGWVRDKFLGRPAIDIDIATNAGYPEVFKAVNPLGGRVTSLPRNTLRVTMPTSVATTSVEGTPSVSKSFQIFEVSTFRGYKRDASDHSVYLDSASTQSPTNRPTGPPTFRGYKRDASDHSVYLDSVLRDFSINSLMYDPVEERVLDFVNGVDDITNKILRMNTPPATEYCIEAQNVFQDDPVR